MAHNLGFARSGTSSWADDDDIDFHPLQVPPKIAPIETPQPIEEEEIDNHEQLTDEPRRGAYHNDSRDNSRGDPLMNRESHEEIHKNPVPDVGPWKLYVGNLSFRLTENDLADFIGPEGINDIRFPRNHDNRPKGFAYVEFDDKEKLIQALELDGCKIDGRHIKMDVAVDRERKSRDKGWFEKRNNRPPNNRSREKSDTRRERPRLSLLPRTTSEKKNSGTHKSSIFGDAKPRDEIAYQERKKTLEFERNGKANEIQENDAKAREAKETKTKAQAATICRRGSRDDDFRGGRGRGRGDRRSVDGGRGTTVKNETPARKPQPRLKRSDPSKTKMLVSTPAKTANAYDLLDDSESESD